MGKTQQRSHARPRKNGQTVLIHGMLASFGLSVGILMSGCAHEERRAPAGDPLASSAAIPAAGGSILAPPVPVDKVPPLPVSSSTMSNAALASGAPKPLAGGNDLRIGSGAASGTWPGPATADATTLRPPEPTALPVTRPVLPVARGVPASTARVASYEQAQTILAAHGVKWQRLETVGENGEWKFSCSIPNRQNAYISRTYEAKATHDMAAIQAVLDQIESERAGGL